MPTAPPTALFPSPSAGFDAPFEMLAACHDRVGRTLALLDRLRDHLRRRAAEGAADVVDADARHAARDVLRYFDVAAPHHHTDEERHVLPALRAGGDAALESLADRLAGDHVAMAQAWSDVRPTLAAIADGGWEAAAADAAFERWAAFAALYRDHASAEDDVAFPAARRGLDDAALAAIGDEMARRRGVR